MITSVRANAVFGVVVGRPRSPRSSEGSRSSGRICAGGRGATARSGFGPLRVARWRRCSIPILSSWAYLSQHRAHTNPYNHITASQPSQRGRARERGRTYGPKNPTVQTPQHDRKSGVSFFPQSDRAQRDDLRVRASGGGGYNGQQVGHRECAEVRVQMGETASQSFSPARPPTKYKLVSSAAGEREKGEKSRTNPMLLSAAGVPTV